MQQQLLFFIGLYLLVTLAIGYWASRKVKTTRDFVVAGRQLPLFVAASGLFGTWFGSETIMGASAEFVEHGLIGVIEDPFGAALCLVLVGAFFARPLYRLNILTFNDFYRMRFDRKTEVISAFFMIPSYFGWIAAQLVALATVLHVLSGVPIFVGIIFCALVVLIYTFIGGMWAVSITDTVQTVMILVGLLVLTIKIVHDAGGLTTMVEEAPDGFFRFFPAPTFKDWIHYFAAWVTIGLGSIPQQDIFQRVTAAKSEKTAVRASYLSGLMYLSIGFLPLIIAWGGKMTYAGDIPPTDTQMVIPMMVLQHTGMGLQILFFGALLSAILSTTSGAMLAPATVIGENLIKPQFKNLTDKQLLRIMRWSVVFIAVCSVWMGMLNANIYDLVGQSSALSLVSLFIPLTAGLYWKRATRLGALLSIVLGGSVWLGCEWAATEIPALIYGTIASIIAMILGSLIRRDNSYQDFQTRLANQPQTVE